MALPRPPSLPKPPIRNMTDFVVFAFVSIVAFILVSATIGVLISGLVSPEKDQSQLISILADIVTSLISALVGFLAGKGAGRSEAEETTRTHEERMEIIKQGAPIEKVDEVAPK